MADALRQKLWVFDIERFAIHDGPGIRTAVFLQGCPLRCPWCANPESWRLGTNALGGQLMPIEDILAVIMRDKTYYDNSGGGVTLTGGEPFYQHEAMLQLLKLCKYNGLHVSIETSGHVAPAHLMEAQPFIDLFLFDIKSHDKQLLHSNTGANPDLIFSNLRMLAQNDPRRIIIRVPVIPGFNHNTSTIQSILALAKDNGIDKVHLLPYHPLGKDKFKRLGIEYPYAAYDNLLGEGELAEYIQMGRKMGLTMQVGG